MGSYLNIYLLINPPLSLLFLLHLRLITYSPLLEYRSEVMDASTKQVIDDGKQYVVVKADNESETPKTAASDIAEEKEEGSQCPEILYKVQYKDYSGEIKGTKELSAP